MSNSYFQFKQFIINQDKAAMKVTTDACLFGALVAQEIENKAPEHILDIGAGTGLLSLMLAQKTAALIDAVEIDFPAFQQAKENFALSPWQQRLTITHTDIKEYSTGKKYDLVISNPPFFDNYLQSADKQKNAAKHTTTLNFETLINAAEKNMHSNGTFAVLLPYAAVEIFIAAATKAGLYLTKKVLAKQTPKHNHFRGILFLQTTKQETIIKQITKEIIIKDNNNQYTKTFTHLLKHYYLNL